MHIWKVFFLKDYNLVPTDAKIIFIKKFPNISLKDKLLDNYIYTKYRKDNKINKELIESAEKLFHIKDNNNNEITETISYKIEGKDNEFKFIIIWNKEMLNNLKIN